MSTPYGVHSWRNASSNEVNQFNNNFSRQNYQKQCCVLLIGKTGSGKSSICKIMGCEGAKIGHGPLSKTKTNHLLNSNNNNVSKYIFVDTMGTEDSDNFASSDEILKKILQKCFQDGVQYLKVIWTLREEPIRAASELQTAAKFINSLDVNIWNCVLFIRQCGAHDDRIQGLIQSVLKQGKKLYEKDVRKKYFGVCCIDNMFKPRSSDLERYNDLIQLKKNPNDKGYYTKKDYINLLIKQLNTLQKIKLKWNIKKCLYCSEIGDSRFIYSNCHERQIKYHVKPYKYHSGNCKHRHIGSWRGIKKSEVYHVDSIYDHINRSGNTVAGFLAYLHPGTHIARVCQGSTQRTRRWTEWSWSCCDNSNQFSTGCRSYCSDCNNSWGGTGCAHKCGDCHQSFDPTNGSNVGCKSKCSKCNQQWGTTRCH